MKQSGYLARQQAERARRDEEVRHHTRVYMLDIVTAALGRMGWGEKRFVYMLDIVTAALGRMGWGEKRFEKFDKVLTEVSDDFAKLILTDVKDDKDLVYSKACLDRELAQYVGKRFIPYDERYKF